MSWSTLEWNIKQEDLKVKRGKRLPLRISPNANYSTLREEVEKSGKTFIAISTMKVKYTIFYTKMARKQLYCLDQMRHFLYLSIKRNLAKNLNASHSSSVQTIII